MQRIELFRQYPDITAFFSQRPDRSSELIPALARDMKKGEYMIKPHLVHGKHVQVVDEAFLAGPHISPTDYPELAGIEGYIETDETDGLVTGIPGVALISTHGDCIPVWAADPVCGVVGVAHAGWKGTRLGIAGELAAVMKAEYGCRVQDIHMYIGPGIDKCCFEVTEEVVRQFRETSGWMEEFIRQAADREHCLIDLKGINRRYAQLEGVSDVEVSSDCTCCMEDRYWSYRRAGEMDRMLAYIRIDR